MVLLVCAPPFVILNPKASSEAEFDVLKYAEDMFFQDESLNVGESLTRSRRLSSAQRLGNLRMGLVLSSVRDIDAVFY